jgi:uncharacterized membrane protein YkvA (DUF1232 family)
MNYDDKDFWDSPVLKEKQFDTEEEIERGTEYVEERLWNKVEREGSKIRFAKDVKALYRYMRDKHVQWYRKSIVVAALIYFISPIDTIPDFTPLFGFLDDLGVIVAAIKFLGSEIVPYYD